MSDAMNDKLQEFTKKKEQEMAMQYFTNFINAVNGDITSEVTMAGMTDLKEAAYAEQSRGNATYDPEHAQLTILNGLKEIRENAKFEAEYVDAGSGGTKCNIKAAWKPTDEFILGMYMKTIKNTATLMRYRRKKGE